MCRVGLWLVLFFDLGGLDGFQDFFFVMLRIVGEFWKFYYLVLQIDEVDVLWIDFWFVFVELDGDFQYIGLFQVYCMFFYYCWVQWFFDIWLMVYLGILIIRFLLVIIVWQDSCELGFRFQVLFSMLFLSLLDGFMELRFLWMIMWQVVQVQDFLQVCLILMLLCNVVFRMVLLGFVLNIVFLGQ